MVSGVAEQPKALRGLFVYTLCYPITSIHLRAGPHQQSSTRDPCTAPILPLLLLQTFSSQRPPPKYRLVVPTLKWASPAYRDTLFSVPKTLLASSRSNIRPTAALARELKTFLKTWVGPWGWSMWLRCLCDHGLIVNSREQIHLDREEGSLKGYITGFNYIMFNFLKQRWQNFKIWQSDGHLGGAVG